MHRAPAVSFLVTRSRWHLWAVVLLWSLGFAVAWVFFLRQPEPVTQALIFTCSLGAGIGAWRGWQNSPQGRLQWDGQHWHWSGLDGTRSIRLHLLLDFQGVLLVSARDEAQRGIWLWLERPEPVDMRWNALRRAVVGNQGFPGAPDQHDKAQVSLAAGDDL